MPILTNVGDFALFKQSEPYLYVQEVRDYTANIQGEVAALEFRWSSNNSVFSAWIELSTQNLRNLVLDPSKEFWIEFRGTLVSAGPVTLDNFQIEIEQTPNDKFAGFNPNSFTCWESGNITSISRLEDLCFNPYDVNPAICLYDELNYMVNNLFGHKVEYFRTVADTRATDIRLFEHTLYNVMPAVCLKVMVNGNEFPDSTLSYNPFGVEFEKPFEIEVTKKYWEEIFGYTTAPQKRDILYFSLNNRIYEVLSSSLVKGFMEQDTHWKISLIKYQPKSNRYEPEEVRSTLDSLTTDTSKLFETELRENEEELTNPQQYNRFIGTTYDPSRKAINENINVVEKRIENFSNVIAEYYYDFSNLVKLNNPTQESGVQYHQTVDFGSNKDISFSCWFKSAKPAFITPSDSIDNMALDTTSNQLIFILSKNRNYQIGDYIKISRVGGINIFGTIVNVGGPTTYTIAINPDVIEYINTYNSQWSGLSSYKAERIVPGNLIYGYDETTSKGVIMDLIANRYIRITLNSIVYVMPLDADITSEDFYGVFINVSNEFRQISSYLWQRKWVANNPSSPQTTDLFNIYNRTINNVEPDDRSNTKVFEILASNTLMTNIRLYDTIVEFEKQSLILNQNIVKDSQRALIIDNALPRLSLPFIGQSK